MAIPDDLNSPLYQDAERYDAEHWWKTDDLLFWERMTRRYGPKVLELAAGTGRLANIILAAGASYLGVDASQPFLDQAKSKLAGWGGACRLVQSDIRTVSLGETFDLIVIGFNSFLHLLTDADALLALRQARTHCHAGSRLIIDIFVPEPVFLYRPPDLRVEGMTYVDPQSGETVKVMESNDYDPETGVNRIHWYYSTATRPNFLVYDFAMRMYFPDTMDRLLTEAGFRIEAKWGNYEELPLGPDSQLQIYVALPEGG